MSQLNNSFSCAIVTVREWWFKLFGCWRALSPIDYWRFLVIPQLVTISTVPVHELGTNPIGNHLDSVEEI